MVNTKTEIQLFTSLDVSRAGDELVKLLLGKESEGEGKVTESESLRFWHLLRGFGSE